MTETISTGDQQTSPVKRGFSSLQKALFGVLAFFFPAIHPVFWILEFHVGIARPIVSSVMVIVVVVAASSRHSPLPWLRLPDQRDRTRSQRLAAPWSSSGSSSHSFRASSGSSRGSCSSTRSGQGVHNGSLWTYLWSPFLLGGDARYLNGDPLIVCLEWIALFVGIFETYALISSSDKASASPTPSSR